MIQLPVLAGIDASEKKYQWRDLRCLWVEPDIRNRIILEVEKMKNLTGITQQKLVGYLGIGRSKFSSWKTRFGEENKHNSETPKHGVVHLC